MAVCAMWVYLHLHFRIGDIVHADDPVDNGKGSGNDGTDDVRHHSCSSKTSFRFQTLVFSFPGWQYIFKMFKVCLYANKECNTSWHFSRIFRVCLSKSLPFIKTFERLTLFLLVDRKQLFIWSPEQYLVILDDQNVRFPWCLWCLVLKENHPHIFKWRLI